MQAGPIYRFGEWRLDAGQRLLFHKTELVPLAPKLLETLVLLIQHHGRIVEKEELISAIWPGTFVEDGSLLRNVSTLRKVLGDGESGSRFIETIPKRGYRFVAAVEVEPGAAESEAGSSHARAARIETRGPRRAVAAGLALAGALAVAGYFTWQRAQPATAAPVVAKRASLAVLPFQNLTGDAGQEYFADGLTEELITQISQMNPAGLGVIARTSSMKYKSAPKGVDEVGRDLGVDYVLEGSVRNEEGRVRISAQLIQVRDQTHLWAQNYDRDLRGVVALQDDVARAIAGQIHSALPAALPAKRRPATTSTEAHEAYLQGRYHWNTRSYAGLTKSLEYFRVAIEKDANYALAYSGIADAYNLLVDYYFMAGREGFPLGQAAARKALALDETLGQAHASLAFSKFEYDYDWAGAEREFRRAIELNPSYAVAHQWYARFLVTQGRFAEARVEARRTRELDPHSVSARINIGHVEYNSRNYEEAIREMKKLLQLEPQNPWAQVYLAMSYSEKGMHAEALEAAKTAKRIFGSGGSGFLEAYCLAHAGRKDAARPMLKRMKAIREKEHIDLIYLAGIHGALGEPDEAMALLEQAYAERSHVLGRLRVLPWLDPLREEPRFRALLQKMNLPPPQ